MVGRYRNLSVTDRALWDGKLIVYHFYVGGLMLLVLASLAASKGYNFPMAMALSGAVSLMIGIGFHLVHRAASHGPNRDPYLRTIYSFTSHRGFPIVPVLLWLLMFLTLLMLSYFVKAY